MTAAGVANAAPAFLRPGLCHKTRSAALTLFIKTGAILIPMSDSLERLYLAVLAARHLDPATSRTARLFQRGPAKMAKKLAEEAIEVVIDAVHGDSKAVIRESADLLYNLTVLWASAGVRPEDVWREMARREDMLGIAEKLPKSPMKLPKVASPRVAARRPIVAIEGRAARKRH